MPVRVLGPDGQTYVFPDGTDKGKAVAYFKKQGITAAPSKQNQDQPPVAGAPPLRNWRQRLLGPNASATTPLLNTDVARNVASHVGDAITGPVKAFASPANGTVENAITNIAGPGVLAGYRTAVEPSVAALREAFRQRRAGNIGLTKDPYDAQGNYKPTVVSSAMDAIPIVGPWSRNVENEARTKGAVPALAGMGTDIAAGELLPKVAAAVPNTVRRAGARIIAPRSVVDTVIPGDTVTPRQRYNTAKQQGVNLDTAQATNSKVPAAAKKVSEHSLTGSGRFAENQAGNVQALEDHARHVTNSITPDSMSREDFGTGVQTALRQHQELLNGQAGQIFEDLDSRVGGGHPDLATVRAQAQKIVADNTDYYKSHPEMLNGQTGRAWSIVNSLAEEPKTPTPKRVPFDDGFGPRPTEPAKPAPKPDSWSNLHKLRSDLMNMYRSPDIVGSNAEGWLKQLTGKVDESMTGAASGLSPADEMKFRQANKIYTDMKQTYDNPQSPLYHIVRAQDGTTASNALSRVTPHVARQIRQASVDLGMPELNDQLQRQTVERLLDPDGDGSPDLKNLPSRFGKTQKEQLGGVLTPDQVQSVEDLARTSRVVHADSNPSGTAKTIQPASEMGGMVAGAGTAATGLATGNPALVVAGAAPFAEAAATRFASRKLTDPRFTDTMMNPPSGAPSVNPAIPPALTAANVTEQQDQPTIQDKEVVPADQSRGVQPVNLPVKVPPYAKPGPYVTQLSPDDETQFQSWVKQNKVPFENDSSTSDYDMRGYWKAMNSGDANAKQSLSGFDGTMHFPDTFKTPYHKTFSNESMYATPDAPHWEGDRLVGKDGNVVADETPKAAPATVPPPAPISAAPSPDTHHFSKAAWSEQNPTGDPNDAADLAKQAGYEVQP
jgi:hypothetical protein